MSSRNLLRRGSTGKQWNKDSHANRPYTLDKKILIDRPFADGYLNELVGIREEHVLAAGDKLALIIEDMERRIPGIVEGPDCPSPNFMNCRCTYNTGCMALRQMNAKKKK